MEPTDRLRGPGALDATRVSLINNKKNRNDMTSAKHEKQYVPTLESFAREMNEEMSAKPTPLHINGPTWSTDATDELPAIEWNDPHRQALDADDSPEEDSQYLYLFKPGTKVWRGYGQGTDGKEYIGIFGDENEDPQVWDVTPNHASDWKDQPQPEHDGPSVDPYGNEI